MGWFCDLPGGHSRPRRRDRRAGDEGSLVRLGSAGPIFWAGRRGGSGRGRVYQLPERRVKLRISARLCIAAHARSRESWAPRRTRRRPRRRPLYCRTCDTTPPRVPLRDRRDARPHAHHLLRHPDVRRPAVPGRAAVDGADARARPVRPRRQADAALRRLHARRHRRLRAARGWVQGGPKTPFIKRVIGLPGETVEIKDGGGLDRRHAPRRAVHLRPPADDRDRRAGALGDPGGPALRDGRPPRRVGRLARLRADRAEHGHRARLAPLLAALHARDPAHARPTRRPVGNGDARPSPAVP